MWCFTRRAGQKLCIGDEIVLSVERIRGGSVRLGFVVPAEMTVDREEIAETKKRERIAANLRYAGEQQGAADKPAARRTRSTPRQAAPRKLRNHPPRA